MKIGQVVSRIKYIQCCRCETELTGDDQLAEEPQQFFHPEEERRYDQCRTSDMTHVDQLSENIFGCKHFHVKVGQNQGITNGASIAWSGENRPNVASPYRYGTICAPGRVAERNRRVPFPPGGMAERTKAVVLKTTVGSRPPGVRIPLPPPKSEYTN